MIRVAAVLLMIAMTTSCGPGAPPAAEGLRTRDAAADSRYSAGIEKWRAEREQRLRSDAGWLTVAGLFWLKPGVNTIGTSERDRIVLPASAGVSRLGAIELAAGKATLTLSAAAGAKVNGKSVPMAELRSDADTQGNPDTVTLGDLSFFLIRRGERLGVRLKDKNSELRRNFQGLSWYPVDPAWRIEARWIAYPEPKRILVDSLTGDKQENIVPGVAVFTVDGREHRLEPAREGDELFFVFRDATAGKTTYPAARFLYSKVENEKVVLDFNKAYNPPCAFTPYATCPLPTAGNRLPVEIPAGEMNYKGAH